MDTKPEVTSLASDFKFEGGLSDYVPAPVKEPLEAHVYDIGETTQIDNFKTRPDGTDNPNFGKEVQKLVFKFKLDESDAKGQVYTCWVSNNVSERSNLGKIGGALFNEWKDLINHTKAELLGLPLRIVLRPGKTDPTKLVVDVDKLLGPSKTQKKSTDVADTVVSDVPDGGVTEDDLKSVFDDVK